MVCKMSYVPLSAENRLQNMKKNYRGVFLSFRWIEMLT